MDPLEALDRPVVLLSHRGPVAFRRGRNGPVASRSPGGLATALSGLSGRLPDAVWICAAASAEDRKLAEGAGDEPLRVRLGEQPRLLPGRAAARPGDEGPSRGDPGGSRDVGGSRDSGGDSDPDPGGAPDRDSVRLRMLAVDRRRHEQFYGVIANPLLWFVQHALYGLAQEPVITRDIWAAFDRGYVAVNRQFAAAVTDEVRRLGGRALVMLHDYHFYLVGEQVRRDCPDAVLTHFVHIPWPGPEHWRVLPPRMRESLLSGLLGCDVVAFHTHRFARNFLLCAQEVLGLPVDLRAMSVRVGDREVWARAYPISVDVDALGRLAAGRRVARHKRALGAEFLEGGRRLIVRVDRTDPSKNIVRGFRAFDVLLSQHPELRGRVSFFAMLQPSRQDVPVYADYIAAIGSTAAEINARHGGGGWQPIELRLEEDLSLAVAAYALCDVLMVNAVNDGMNLVAKEMVLVNERAGVLLLSESTGAHEELGYFAETIHPCDVQQQADALFAALTADPATRRRRLEQAAATVRANDVDRWLAAQVRDVLRLDA